MEYTRHYKNMTERTQRIATAEGNGYRMLHDDFDADWKKGTEPHGTLTFTKQPPEQAPVEVTRDLAAEIDTLKAEIEILKNK